MFGALNKKLTSITTGAIVIALFSLVSRLLGVVRDRVLAGQFGASDSLDVYYAAFRLPDLIYNLIILGALSAGIIPVLASLVADEDSTDFETNKVGWHLVSNLLNVFSSILIVLGFVLFLTADRIVPYISPGFSGDKLVQTIALTRVMFLSPIILGVSGIVSSVLQTYRRFFVYSLAPIMYNIGIIIGAFFFVPKFGLIALAWGVILGALLHLVIQLPALFRLGFRYRLIYSWSNKNLRKIFKLTIPRFFALASSQINLIVITIFGSFLASGSIAIYNLANNLQSFPVSLIGISLAIAAFPAMSRAFAQSDEKSFVESYSHTFRLILFLIIPASILFIMLRFEIVNLILGVGKFNLSDARLTATALGLFSLSFFSQALIPLVVRAFYARQKAAVPLVASLISDVVNILLCWQLSRAWGLVGLISAFSVSSIIYFVILIVMTRLRFGDLADVRVIRTAFKTLTAGVAMVAGLYFASQSLGTVWLAGFWVTLGRLSLLSVFGLAIFTGVSYILRSEDLLSLISAWKRKLSARPSEPLEKID